MDDDEARRAGFASAADMAAYADAHQEDWESEQYAAAGEPSPLAMWRQVLGSAQPDIQPLTIQQAAERENVKDKTIRRKLPALVAMDPPGAFRIGDGARAPWRIIPAALDQLRGVKLSPSPVRPAPPKARRAPNVAKRSATRWEA